jgi:holin-like protein
MSPFLTGITWLLLFQCAGEALSRLLAAVPVPGPVIGMLLLFVALRARDRVPESVGTAADALAKHLSLLFVPAGVGVMMYFGRLAGEWIPIAVALVVSTVAAIATSALTFAALARRRHPAHGAEGTAREP